MVAPKKLAHIALKTSDLESAKAWYLNVLEARVVFENEMLCFTTYDEEHHRLVLAKVEGFEQNAETAGLHHVANVLFAQFRQCIDTPAAPISPDIDWLSTRRRAKTKFSTLSRLR